MPKSKNRSIIHLVCLGESGFPHKGSASIEKLKLICKGIVEAGGKVTVINRKGVFSQDKILFDPAGKYHGVNYVYASNTIYRPSGFLKRNWQKIVGYYGEINYLSKYNREDNQLIAFVSTMNFFTLVFYFLLSKIYSFKLCLSHVELNIAMQHHDRLIQKMSDILIDRYAFSLVDAAFPISELLIQDIARKNPLIPCLKLPILCDFETFDIKKDVCSEPYFLYCGSLSYIDVVYFIIESFEKLNSDENYHLYLVVNGNSKQKKMLKDRIYHSSKKELIDIFSNIPFDELVQKYIDAQGLLIPLRPTLQDAARFPNKIGEYLASGNPMISTNYGEVAHYFTDGHTALIAQEYDVQQFAEKMNFIIQNPNESSQIGLNGRKLGYGKFDYVKHGRQMLEFLQSLTNN